MARIDTKTELQLANALEHLEGTRRELEVLAKAGFRAPENQPDLDFRLLKIKTAVREAQLELRKLLLAEKTYLNPRESSLYRAGRYRAIPAGKCAGCGRRN